MADPLDGHGWPVTQTWEQHVKNTGVPGTRLGGVDHAMGVGTLLPVVPGVLSFVTPSTPRPWPKWYNSGLGYAGVYTRPDGTGTVYGHLSKAAPVKGQCASGGAKGAPGAGTSTGPHCHVMDFLPNGDRVFPGSTINPDNDRKETPMSIIASGRTSDGSIYAQFEPGCPFYPFPSLAEWSSVAAATGATYAEWGTDTSVIKKFGTSTDWAKLAPSTVGGTVNVTADMAATNALLTELIAATKALNPPG